jgi:two-component system, chemotaxis family, chemotaxis protein CheY
MFPPDTRFLVVDDMESVRELVREQLVRMGFTRFVQAKNGNEAWEIIVKEYAANNPIQVVLSDWNMPFLSGIELLKKVRSTPQFANLPFLLITAEGEKRQVLEAIKMKVTEFMVKPIASKAFQQKLESAWEKVSAAKSLPTASAQGQ